MAIHLAETSEQGCAMDRQEAETLYDLGKELTVNKLLELGQENKTLKLKIASLSKNSTNSSKPPSSDGPQVKREKKKRRAIEIQGVRKATKERNVPCCL